MTLAPAKKCGVIVNDDSTQLRILSSLVKKAGIEPHIFERAELALAAMDTANPPDLIVTDLYMPGIDGWRFCRLLRSPEYITFNKVPILVVSATFAGDQTERIAADIGADAFLPSPVDGKVFIDQVCGLLQGKAVHQQPRVLIVEDSPSLAGLLEAAFVSHGFHADHAMSILEAEKSFRGAVYDLAVLDYHLPDGKGDSLLDIFQALHPSCVCLMMTTDPTPELALDWMKRGASAYLRKPFEPEYLVELCARARREKALLRAEDLLELRTRELRESEAQLRLQSLVLDQIQDQVTVTDLNGIITYVNDAEVRSLGYPRQELVGVSTEKYGENPEQGATQRQILEETLKHGVWRGEVVNHSADGRDLILDCRTQVVRDEQGQPVALAGISTDITEGKRAEVELEQEVARRRILFDISPDGIVVIDPSTAGFIEFNRIAHEQLGYTRQEFSRLSIFDVEAKETIAETQERIAEVMLSGKADFETRQRTKTGELRYIHVTAQYYHVQNQAIYHCIWRDITERKQDEAEREKLQAQLNQAQKMESVGRLAGGVAHDFNNMLGVILGHVEMTLEGLPPGSHLYEGLREIQKAAQRSADLTRQLLAFARKQTVMPRVIDLNEIVEGMLKLLHRLIGEDINLIWLPAVNLKSVKIDPSQVDQLLANLCVNARDAIGGTGQVVIETGNEVIDDAWCAAHPGSIAGAYVRLSVRDNGCGMGQDVLDKLFEPFFTTKGLGKGTGLGLATVYGIIKQNNGFIDVVSKPGVGTSFNLYLPFHRDRPCPGIEKRQIRGVPFNQETILLVEDEVANLHLTATMLRHLGLEVLTAENPTKAVEQAKHRADEIRLLITDVVMPGMNGQELARILSGFCPNLRCLFMSGYTADVIGQNGQIGEEVLFLQKPFSLPDLEDMVSQALWSCVQKPDKESEC